MTSSGTGKASEGSELLLHAYVDGELDVAGSLQMERTIESDPAAANSANDILALQKVLREKIPREPIPPYLRSRIEKAALGRRPSRVKPSWRLMAASVVAAIALSSASTWFALQLPTTANVANEIVDSHMRSLAATQQVDVVSSDGHTVKPWFNGRIPYSPRVVDLANEGFPLAGGRIDVIRKDPVPTLVYTRRLHVISLTAIPRSLGEMGLLPVQPANGFNVVSWVEGDTTYWAVSDLNASELGAFANLFRRAS